MEYKDRENFYAPEMNYDRMDEQLTQVISHLTLNEILKMIREISYDMVCYYDDENKGYIYKDGHSELNQEQACRIQRLLSTACDLFSQSVIDKREFDDDYLAQWLDGGFLQRKVASLEEENEKLKDEIKYLEGELNGNK